MSESKTTRELLFHADRRDFRVDYFSGTGAGRDAFATGLDISNNPHAPQSENAFMWDFGWAEAHAGR